MTDQATSQLADRGEGRCALSGVLTLESVPWLWKELQKLGLLSAAREADLSGLANSDSAGLALLIAWRACCRSDGGDLVFAAVPERLMALAHLTDAEGLLQAQAQSG
jgi:phospholipid transport system transporter-binding protein